VFLDLDLDSNTNTNTNTDTNNDDNIIQRREALQALKTDFKKKQNETNILKMNNSMSSSIPSIPSQPEKPVMTSQPSKKKRIITTRTFKYKLGKSGKNIGVLIKNAKTRKRIQHEYVLLKQKPIEEIKSYLRSQNLLKIGSIAPNNVLRELFEQSILSGEIENRTPDVLIHNYMSNN
jgi:hypothetical protein